MEQTTSLRIDAINCPVISLSQLALIPQAHKMIPSGNSGPS